MILILKYVMISYDMARFLPGLSRARHLVASYTRVGKLSDVKRALSGD